MSTAGDLASNAGQTSQGPAGYAVGIDLGTTYSAAALYRAGKVEMVPLGNRSASIPSLVFLREDGTILTGEAAERRGLAEPARLARQFKRRVGDAAPVVLGRTPYSADRLMAQLLRSVIDAVQEREGSAPAHMALTHPANWGPYKTDLVRQSAELAGVRNATLVTEPMAAAIHYSATERLDVGGLVAVYDLGGGTFDAAILRRTETSFEPLGEPEGIERLGGIDFDEAIYCHVAAVLDGKLDDLDPTDLQVRTSMARLRAECTNAKEALSTDSDTTIPVVLPDLQLDVRITRAEFESMIRPTIDETISALRRAIARARIQPTELATVLLIGGSSRIPLIGELVSHELGRPVSVNTHPKHAVALGAAYLAGMSLEPAAPRPAPTNAPTPATAGSAGMAGAAGSAGMAGSARRGRARS